MVEKEAGTEVITVDAVMENLKKVLSFVRKKLNETEGDMLSCITLEMVVEELYTNIASYAYGKHTGIVTVRCSVKQEPLELIVTFMDHGIPYNPLEHKDPDIKAPLEERKTGGNGILMAKKMMDDMQYEFKDGMNILTIRKLV
ncbi:MAG: ATP-binding protein [Lachnospiraceae bacterium]|nr:ATP-binding protein [Lachnospiraceae bacterium]